MKQKGFTVVEMLIYSGLLVVFLTVLTQIFVSILDVQLESEATQAVEQDSRYVFTRLSYDIRRAAVAVYPANLGEAAGMLQLTIDGTTHTYTISSGVLTLTDENGVNQLTSSEVTVTDFSATRVGNSGGTPGMRLSLTLVSRAQRTGGAEQRTLITTIGLR